MVNLTDARERLIQTLREIVENQHPNSKSINFDKITLIGTGIVLREQDIGTFRVILDLTSG
jgi:hypothetical protein